MAGRRRGTGRKPLVVASTERRRNTLTVRLANARTPVEKVAAASEYARSALTQLTGRDPAAAEQLAAELVRQLTAAGDQAARQAKQATRGGTS